MGYGTVSRFFHWATVVIILIMIPVGLIMVQDIPRPIQDKLFILHKGLGATFLVVIVARIVWRLTHPPDPLPDTLAPLQRGIAAGVHGLLYVLLLTMALSGYTRVMTGGFPIELLDALGIPPLLPKNESVAETAKAIHATTKTVLIAVICIHVGAALFHALVRRDGIINRMWPPLPRR